MLTPCECEHAGWCPVHQRMMSELRWDQCHNQPGFFDVFADAASGKQAARIRPPQLTGGPGSELIAIYSARGIPSCQACYQLAEKMDAWGHAECRKQLRAIVSDILPRAKDWITGGYLPEWAVPSFPIKRQIRRDVLEAIRRAEQKAAAE